MEIISKLFKNCALFAQKMTLNFKDNETFSTVLGGILSLVIVVGNLAFFFYLASEMINRHNPKITNTILSETYAPKITLNYKNNFPYAFRITNSSGYPITDPSIYQIDFGTYSINRTKGSPAKKFDKIYLNLCKKEEWAEKGYLKKYIHSKLNQSFCIKDQNYNVNLEGAYFESYFENAKFQIKMCENNTIPGVVCKDSNYIKSQLRGGEFNFYFIGKYFNFHQFKKPMHYNFDNFHTDLSSIFAKKIDLNFVITTVDTDQGYFLEDIQTTKTFIYDQFREQAAFNGNYLLKFYINSSLKVLNVQRSYMKLQDLTAKIGGILSVCLTIGTLISNYIGRYKMLTIIMNTLYNFQLNISDDNEDEEWDNVKRSEDKIKTYL